jgi:formylglycine-generating enzyme required for sulfatase activity
VDNVSWHDVQDFIEQLHEKEVGEPYRLPTEAEWEYACRTGTTTPFSFGETITADQVNYDDHYPYGGGPRGKRRTDAERVGYFPPNAWGLCEMHGNVRDWVADVYHEYYYKQSPVDDPDHVSGFTERCVIRGGWWGSQAKHCTSSNRDRFNTDVRVRALGFRLVRTVNP